MTPIEDERSPMGADGPTTADLLDELFALFAVLSNKAEGSTEPGSLGGEPRASPAFLPVHRTAQCRDDRGAGFVTFSLRLADLWCGRQARALLQAFPLLEALELRLRDEEPPDAAALPDYVYTLF